MVTAYELRGEDQVSVPAGVAGAAASTSEPQKFPAGGTSPGSAMRWPTTRVKPQDDQDAEIEAALSGDGVTLVAVPTELADEVRALIASKQAANGQ